MAAPEAWRSRAACKDLDDPNVMFPLDGDEPGIETAKSICAICPVKSPCLDHAIATNEQHGVMGGMGEEERRKYRRSVLRARLAAARKNEGQESLFPS